MLLTIDVGNTNVVLLVFDDSKKVRTERFETIKEDVYATYVNTFKRLNFEDIDEVVVSSVVPRIYDDLYRALRDVYQIDPFFINSQNILGFKTALKNSREIGADFIATSVGAFYKYGGAVIVADIGSATKLSLTTAKGVYAGGVIMPGVQTSLQAFQDFIPHLPKVALEVPKKVIGNDTVTAIQSGLLYGLVANIEGLAKRMEEEYGKKCVWVLTGGYANLIKNISASFIFDADLLHDGLHALVVEKRLIC